MVLTPENSKELPDKYKQALANKVQTVQARIADIPHDKVTTIIHAQKQPKRVFFLCEDESRVGGCGRFLGDNHAAIPWL